MFSEVGRIIANIGDAKSRYPVLETMMPSAPAISVNPSLSQRFAGLEQPQRLRIVLGVALFIAIGIVGLMMGRQAEWRVLYANLADTGWIWQRCYPTKGGRTKSRHHHPWRRRPRTWHRSKASLPR